MNTKDLDLNLLKILQAVVETRNTSLAANVLGISQTSVSRGIVKLKECFGPQLFVRKSHGLEPSELAIKLAQASSEMLIPVEKAVEAYLDFEAESYSGHITLLVNTFLLEFFGADLILTLRQAFPEASFNFAQWQKDSLHDTLKGHVDYVIQFGHYTFPQELHCHHLAKIENSIIARKDHPVLSKGSDWERVGSLPITRLFLEGINPNKGVLESIYEQNGYQAKFLLTTHSISSAVAVLKTSDAILYSNAIISASDSDLSHYPLPSYTEPLNSLDVNGLYLQTRRGNPLMQHLHQTIQAFFDAQYSREEC
ncbi:transcriptional regulator [Vibrio xuii]|nr:transcriptional regulator [Vibrio xuii]